MAQIYGNLAAHQCFDQAADRWFKTIYLPVALRCNLKCYYCMRTHDCPNENRAMAMSKVLAPAQALKKVKKVIREDARMRVVSISGPGEPLANKETYDTLRLIRREFPQVSICVSTNGLLLPQKIDELVDAGVSALSVTVNAIDSQVAAYIYGWITYQGEVYEGEAAAAMLIDNQLAGIKQAASRGLAVRVNSILMPGINEDHMFEIAITVKRLGACIMRVVPMVPEAEFAAREAPTAVDLNWARQSLAAVIRQSSGYFDRGYTK